MGDYENSHRKSDIHSRHGTKTLFVYLEQNDSMTKEIDGEPMKKDLVTYTKTT